MDSNRLQKDDKALFQEDDLLCLVKVVEAQHNDQLYLFTVRIIKIIRNNDCSRHKIILGSKLFVARHRGLKDIFASWTMTKIEQLGSFL